MDPSSTVMAFLSIYTRPFLPQRFSRLLLSTSSFAPKSFRFTHPPLVSLTTRCHLTTTANTADASPSKQQEDGSDMFATGISLKSLGVSPDYAQSLAAKGIVTPTKAQAAIIPIMLHGLSLQVEYAAQVLETDAAQEAQISTQDQLDEDEGMMGQEKTVLERPQPPEEDVDDVLMFGAETGSGKTLAYLLPYVETVRKTEVDLKAVILVPSRELCWQVAGFLSSYFPDAPMHVVLAGGRPPDVSDVENVRVIIATPGALLNYFRFSQKADASDKMIVVDEADMLLTGSFLRDVERILDQPGMKPFATRRNGSLRRVNRNRLLFVGATYPHWTGEKVRSIVTWMKRRYPHMKAVQTENIHKRSRQLRSRWHFMKSEVEKLNGLIQILEQASETDKMMVFSSKAETCRRVYEAVLGRLGHSTIVDKFGAALELHKHVHSVEREENLKLFRSGEGRLMFCTDLGSRGLDLGNVSWVVEYDFATNVVAYLHRIGRTARVGASGRTDHFYDEVSQPLADAIRERSETEGTVVEGVFSRNRSFRKRWKKRVGDSEMGFGMAQSMTDVEIDGVDEEEEERLGR